MKANSKFDYIIVGGGLSGLHLSYCFFKDKYFNNCSILIIDKGKSKKSDNYFSYWESGAGNWDTILKNKWNKGDFFSSKEKLKWIFQIITIKL